MGSREATATWGIPSVERTTDRAGLALDGRSPGIGPVDVRGAANGGGGGISEG
jgi:hypothetical protein